MCPPGQYRSFELKRCKKCPENSHSKSPGSAYCACKSGYYRNKIDPKYVPCLPSPGPPTNLTLIFLDQNSAILSWNYPDKFVQRRHRHNRPNDDDHQVQDTNAQAQQAFCAPLDHWCYDLQFKSKCKQCSENVVFTPTYEFFNDTKLTMTNLDASTAYKVQIHAHNGPQYNRIKLRKFQDDFILNENQFYSNGSMTGNYLDRIMEGGSEKPPYITSMIQNRNFSYGLEQIGGSGEENYYVVIGNGGSHVATNNFENENFLKLFYKKQQNYHDENQQTTDFVSMEITTLANQLANYHVDNVKVVKRTNRVLEVVWDKPTNLDKKLFQHYEIKWFPKHRNGETKNGVTKKKIDHLNHTDQAGSGSSNNAEATPEKGQTKEERFTINNLQPDTEYGIQVRCKMVNGFGQFSTPVAWVSTTQQQQAVSPVHDDSIQMRIIAAGSVTFVVILVLGEWICISKFVE